MNRPTFDSLKFNPVIGRAPIIFKEAQAGMPGEPPGGMSPDMGQSPVTGNPDEMQAPESANQRQFEDDFGSLAYQFVNDRAYALVPYMLGFEVVDRNEDGSKAVGIFGYKVGDDFYYIPAFFLNNQVRGIDMILNKKTNQFVPLTEKWIDFIVNKHSVSIGGPADDRVRDTMRNPDLTFVKRPQVALGKMAEDSTPWTFSEAWAHIKQATAEMISDPLFKEMFEGVTNASKGVEKCAESKYMKEFMEKVGGPECMSRFLKTMHDMDFANAYLTLYKDAEACYTENTVNAAIHVDRMNKIAAAKPKVRVLYSTEGLLKQSQDVPATDVGGDDEDKPLTVEENARQIVEHDFTIEDVRPKEDVSEVTEDKVLVNFEHRFNPPSGPGKYNFVMSDGMTREGIMLNKVASQDSGNMKNATLFLFDDGENEGGKVVAQADPLAILTTDSLDDSNDSKDAGKDVLKDLYDQAKPIYNIEVSGGAERDKKYYVFIDDKGNAAGPFVITSTIVDGDDVSLITGYGNCTVNTSAPEGLQTTYGFNDWDLRDRFHDADGYRVPDRGYCDPCDKCYSMCSGDIIRIGTFSGMPKKSHNGIIIPQDWRAIEVESHDRYPPFIESESDKELEQRKDKALKEYARKELRYTFASPTGILECMRDDGVERIKVASDGTEYYIHVDGANRDHGPMNYKSAAVDLVTRFGLRPRRAFSVLSKAASDRSTPVRMLVSVPSLRNKVNEKVAQVGNLVNVSMPAPMEQLPAVDPYSGVPVYQSPYIEEVRGQFTGVPGLPPEGGMTHGINIGGEIERNMGGQEIADEHKDSFTDAALPIDEEAKQLAEEAAAAGQRHVFDQAAIGGLVKVYDTANVVDSYIPDFMDTLDRLGRVLFLFYWKHEDFNQRYGSDDVVQMEDSLRNVFKNLGELTLSLKEKSVQKD